MPSTLMPDRILKQLSELWTNMGKPEEGHKVTEGGVLRACAMTLIAIVDDSDNTLDLGETLAMLMRDHPSRAIVIRLSNDTGHLEGRVFAQCWMPFGHRRQICCEQVEITVSVDRLGDIPQIVSPLAVPDLPRMVWLRTSRLPQGSVTADLLALGDRIIIDSKRPGAPSLKVLRGLLDDGHLVGDLAWARITEVRDLLAQRVAGVQVSSARIDYCGLQPGTDALYLAGWLESVLPGKPVELKSVAEVGSVSEVAVEPGIAIKLGGGCNDFHQPESDYELLNEELRITFHDRIFEHVLRKVT